MSKTMMKGSGVITKVVIWVLIVLALGLLIYGLAVLGSGDGSSDGANGEKVEDQNTSDHVRGNPDAKVVLIEYGDFQCPACGTAHPLVKQLLEELGDNLAFVYRNFPLSIHKNAKPAAYAAEAAGLQGKYFEMYDLLFERQANWSESSDAEEVFAGYAGELGLDVERFKDDVDSDTVKSKVDEDSSSGRKAGVNSTPSFYLNGTKMSVANYEQFMQQVKDAVANSEQTEPAPANNSTSNTATE